MIRNVLGEIRRIPGVGRATLFSTERSLRVWIDADKLVGYQLTSDDVTKAIEAQNAQVASGSLGAEPSRKSQAGLRHGAGQGPARHARGIRRHRAARQSRRFDRAPARRRPHRSGRHGLSIHHAAQRPAERRPVGAAGAHRQCAGNRECRPGQDGRAVEILPFQHQIRNPLRHHPGGRGFDQEGDRHADRGRHPRVPGDAAVSAEHPLHPHPDRRRAGRAARHLRHAAADGTFHQHADAVRDGACHRHSRRRRDRGRGERRAHHVRGRAAAARGDAQGDDADHRRHHRHHAGAGGRVHPDGVLSGLGRRDLSAVLRHHGVGHRLLCVPRAVAHAGAVRDLAQAGSGRPSPRAKGAVRPVQPGNGQDQGGIQRGRPLDARCAPDG